MSAGDRATGLRARRAPTCATEPLVQLPERQGPAIGVHEDEPAVEMAQTADLLLRGGERVGLPAGVSDLDDEAPTAIMPVRKWSASPPPPPSLK